MLIRSRFFTLTAAVCSKYVEVVAAQGSKVIHSCIETCMKYETILSGMYRTKIASALSTLFVAMIDKEANPRLLNVKYKLLRQEDKTLTLWVPKVEMAMDSGLVSLEHQRVTLAISKLRERNR